jgi:hypothetical protein
MTTTDNGHETLDRWVDIVSVILLSLTAVFSALCVYQSGRWGGEQTFLYNEASNQRIEAGIASAKANQLEVIDVGMFQRYVDAVYERNPTRERFIYHRFRPEARAALDAWLKTEPLKNPHAPASPFSLPEYHVKAAVEDKRLNALASQTFRDATTANRNSDEFLLLTVTFAAVAFLGGMSTKFRFPFHLIVVVLGCVALVYGVIRMSGLPFR